MLRTLQANSAELGSGERLSAAKPIFMPASDGLDRDVFGLLGIPVDAVSFPILLKKMAVTARTNFPFLISTPNVNFLVKSQHNSVFRESMLLSDLCLIDGMPLIWIARMMGIPVRERIAGSDLFVRLKSANEAERPLRVFLVGGADGVAATVAERLNSQRCGLECVGALNPGFGSIEEMSAPHIIDTINSSRADLVAVFFGAEKAQAWLVHNHQRLLPPIRAQFGATINFEAGTLRRAPPLLRSTGFEWLWRIKEEPYLWRRYWSDGRALLKLIGTSVLPLVVRASLTRGGADLSIGVNEDGQFVRIKLTGMAVAGHINKAIECFRNVIASRREILVDVSEVRDIDPRFLGLLLMVRKLLSDQGQMLKFSGVSGPVRRIFRLNRFEYLLSHEV